MNREMKSTTTNIPTADNDPEAFLETFKYKPFRFGDYYYLKQPELELRNELDVAIDSLAELTTHIFNRTHQSRYTVFPTLYQQFKQLLNYTDNIVFNSPDHKITDNSYFINLMFRESKLVGFRYIDKPTISGIYFMSYYNTRVDLRPITHIYVIKREHLVSIIDYLEEYNYTGFVLRTSNTKQPIKKFKI